MDSNNRNHQGNNTVANMTSDKEKMIPQRDFENLYREHPLTEDTTCGFGPIRSAWLQKFANKKAYVFIYGLLGCTFTASYAYFNGTITTLEKRFKIPSRTTGKLQTPVRAFTSAASWSYLLKPKFQYRVIRTKPVEFNTSVFANLNKNVIFPLFPS